MRASPHFGRFELRSTVERYNRSIVPSFRKIRVAAAFVSLALLAGCMSPAINDPARVGPFFEPKNVAHDPTLGGIRRVVLLPVYGGSTASEESVVSMDPLFRQALQQQNRFEIVTLSRSDCQRRFGTTAIASTSPLPHDFFATLRQVYAADAVMFVDITVYHPYHPLALGIRSKLASVANMRLVWTFDNVYSADNPLVASGARHYFLESEHQDVPGDLTPAVLESPGRFAAYAAYTTFATLPPVTLGR